jgi:hypothetical protein
LRRLTGGPHLPSTTRVRARALSLPLSARWARLVESRLKGVDRRKLKFTSLNTLQVGVSVRTNIKSGREGKTNQSRNKADGQGDLFYRGSVLKNLVPIEVVTKTGSLSTLSLSQTVT